MLRCSATDFSNQADLHPPLHSLPRSRSVSRHATFLRCWEQRCVTRHNGCEGDYPLHKPCKFALIVFTNRRPDLRSPPKLTYRKIPKISFPNSKRKKTAITSSSEYKPPRSLYLEISFKYKINQKQAFC